MIRILLICDIDGVLIPFPAADGQIPATHAVDWAQFTGKDEPVRIWLNPAHGEQLISLVETTGAEPAWCSTWREDSAPQIGARLGLPAWPSVQLPTPPTDSGHQDGHLWKHPHVIEHARDAALIWIDDDFTAADHAWAGERAAAGNPTLLIEPDPYIGLTAQHIDAALAWVAGLRAGYQAAREPEVKAA